MNRSITFLLLSPAVGLMNRMSFARKFILTGLIAFIALSITLFNFYDKLNHEVKNYQKELVGLSMIESLSKTVQNLQRHRGVSSGLLSGITEFKALREEKERDVTSSFSTLDAILPASSKQRESWNSILAKWDRIRAKGMQWDSSENFSVHTRLINELLLYETDIADEYELTSDSDLGAFYLAHISSNEILDGLEHLGQIRAYGLSMLGEKRVSEQRVARMINLIAQLEDALTTLKISFGKVAIYIPSIQQSLLTTFNIIDKSSQQTVEAVHSDIISGRFSLSPQDFFALSTSSIDKCYNQLYQVLLPAVRKLSEDRLQHAEVKLHSIIIISYLLLLFAGYLIYAIYYSTIGTINMLGKTVTDFAHGNMQGRVHLETHDELSLIGDSFNAMADNLLIEHNKLDAAFQNSEIGFVLCNARGDDITMNATALRLHEFASAEELNKTIEENVNQWELSYLDGRLMPLEEWPLVRAIRGDFVRDFEFNYHNLKTSKRWVCCLTTAPVRNQVGEVTLIVQTLIDITQRKRGEDNLRVSASVFESTQEAVLITDAKNAIVDVNTAFCRITGYCREEVLGKNPKLLSSGRHDKSFYAKMWNSLIHNKSWRGEIWNRRKSGEVYPELLSISIVSNEEGKVLRYVAVFSDITATKEHEAELRHVAHFDGLTGIPNRILLTDRMKQAIAQTSREQNMMAVCYLDLDGFKPINDTSGHEAGDEVLIEISRRIQNTIRGGDTVARLGGDEFVVLLLDLEHGEECVSTLERLLMAIALPFTVKDRLIAVSASIGVSIYPLDNEDADTLLRHADQAMYQAKQSGKNRFHIYDSELDRRARNQNEFLKSIKQGLEDNQFVLYYQPKVNLLTKELVGVEALIRWQHPERGILPPAEFLSYIENTDLDIKIGEWVTATAIAQMYQWRNNGLDIDVSINISGYHMESSNFIENLRQQIAPYSGWRAGQLQIEVLETVALNDIAVVRGIIDSCRSFGIGFALDDFGTGYSSLRYLSGLPVDSLKIDQSFVRDMLEDNGDMAIVQGIIALARAFELQTVAEGIETMAHYKVLLDMGCDLGQGYGIARPMPASQIIKWKLS